MWIVPAIIAFCKSITALQWIAALLERWDKARNETEALKRLGDKNTTVDAAIDNVLHPSAVEQQRPTDSQGGLPGSGKGGTGVVS